MSGIEQENATPEPAVASAGSETSERVRIDVLSLKAYDHNPRQGENPEYHRIKASIRAEGMEQPLVVTQRPGETAYMTYAGGNTRLRILQELYEETGDKRFREATCVYRSWTGETDVLLAHLRENDLRGDLTFLEKALAVRQAKCLIQDEQNEGAVTQAQLAETLRARGYALSQGLISQMEYTVERLLPLLPAALQNGLGRPQVERIRQLERAVRTLWLDRSVDIEDEFDQAFTALCQRYDNPDWDLANLRRALEAEIAERAAVSIHAVSLVLDGYLAGQRGGEVVAQWSSATHEADADDTGSDLDSEPTAAPQTAASASTEAPAETTDSASLGEPNERLSNAPHSEGRVPQNEHSASVGYGHAAPGGGEPSRSTAQSGSTDITPPSAAATDLKSLRARAWTLASRLAQRNGLSELIQPLSGQGLGFMLADVPDPALVDQLDEDMLAQVSMVWWHLAAAAEVTVAPVEQLLPALAQESVLRRALEDQDAGLLFSSVWTLDPGHMGFRLWRRLDERDWHDLMGLMETYRALHQVAEASGDPLWR